ncbi:MAG: thiamine diphosphokinase [Dehalococcoidia bacterium]|nr:thiamine diphosphokinase [Dehalococcoidia bacterium]
MRALVIANGEPCSAALALEIRASAALIVAADGGADRALSLGLEPDAVVGDLDSASPHARKRLPPGRFHHIPRLDMTDLQKAIAFAIERGATEVDVICAGGGRADHALANLSVLATFRGQARVAIHDDNFAISLVDGTEFITAEPGTLISLVAIGECTGITTHGLRWDLRDFTLGFSPLGVHNEIASSPATVTVESGDLLLFHGRWVEKHA